MVIAVAILIILNGDLLPFTQVTSNTFVNPDWARLECYTENTWEKSSVSWLDQKSLFKCDGFTRECRFKVEDDPTLSCGFSFGAADEYRICDINGQSCSAWADAFPGKLCGGKESNYITIDQGRAVEFKTGAFVANEDHTKVTFQYSPWGLYRFVGGAKYVVNRINCDITTSLKANILTEDYPGSRLYMVGGEGQKWANYVNAWNYGPPTNVYRYNGREVYCNSAKIYDIVNLQVSDGSLVKLNPEYSGQKEDGTIISGMGSFIKSVECCQDTECASEQVCEDFECKGGQRTCFTDAQCFQAGGPIPIDCTHATLERCVSGKCVKQEAVSVECTSDNCCPIGKVCDTSPTNYGKCVTQTPPGYCGDGKCNSLEGETVFSCPEDCGQQGACKDCFEWLLSKFKPPVEQCTPKTYYEEVWYNPMTWILPEEGITQKQVCPIFLAILGVIAVLVFLIFSLAIKNLPKKK